MEQIYHELLIESLPQDLTTKKVLLVGALPQTIAMVTAQNPAHCSAFHLAYNHYTTVKNLGAVSSTYIDIALESSVIPEETFDLILFPITKSALYNLRTLSKLQQLLSTTGVIHFVGLNSSGIKGLASKLKKQGIAQQVVVNKRGGRVLSITSAQQVKAELYLPKETSYQFRNKEIVVSTIPGLFSYGKSDKGTQLLLDNFPKCSGKKMLDVGCGSGVLSLAAIEAGALLVDALDLSATAVAFAQNNCAQQSAITVLGSDMAEGAEGFYDIIITNPPFHDGIKTDLSTGERWLDSLLPHLHKGGSVWLVANSFISYGAMGRARFTTVERLEEKNGFVVYKMTK